jgi:hypothetical protein
VTAGYWPSPWPGEDGGPRRSAAPHGTAGLGIGPGERLEVTSRDAFATTMVVLREPGEVFALRHTIGAHGLEDPSTGWVERIDPHTLDVLERSPDLAAGPLWPGGLAAHANGSLHTVFGRWCHRLAPDCSVLAKRELPRPRPYNSFVALADGTLATKDFDRALAHPAHLSLLDPETLEPRCAEVELPEPVIARLSADGNALYVVGVTTAYRYVWDPGSATLERDASWSLDYGGRPGQSYGWDPVVEGGQLWFLDNGEHTYTTSMLGAGVAPGPVHLVRASLADAGDRELVEVCGAPRGAVTDPPLYDPERRIAVGYDSANAVLAAWRFTGGALEPLWRRRCATAAHMIRYPDTGELVVGDFHDWMPTVRRPALRGLAQRGGRLAASARFRAAAARRCHDDVVVHDIETGEERARAAVPSMFQSVQFPAAGWERDLYWCTFSTLARVAVVSA